jgi:hypothetical protein
MFCVYMVSGACGLAVVLFAFILLVDPYDSVALSPDWQRHPIRSSGRYYNPSIAKREEFDSFVIGSSTAMMLKPAELSGRFKQRFANLAAKSLTPYEQIKTLELVRYNHREIKTLVVSIDTLWCQPQGSERFVGAGARVDFPIWLYDDDEWNDFPGLNLTSLDDTWDQFRALIGVKVSYDVRPDGFLDVTEDLYGAYDEAASRLRIAADEPILLASSQRRQEMLFPDVAELFEALEKLPDETQKLLFLPPYHARFQPAEDSVESEYWHGCKQRLLQGAQRIKNVRLVDYFIDSPLARNDTNFVDGYHHRAHVATEIVDTVYALADGQTPESVNFQVLH